MPHHPSEHSDDFLTRGREYLEDFPDFALVGRRDVLSKLTAILMRKRANSVLLVGPGGVGCSALCKGLQASKDDPSTPFDIVSKRFFWLDGDGLFASGDPSLVNAGFNKTLRTLARTPNSVLILEDMRDFVEAARNNGCTNLINGLMRAVKKKRFQMIMEARDEDLQTVLACHSDMKEGYTLLDLQEPDASLLQRIVSSAAEHRLFKHHRIGISDQAIETAIEVTNKYRVSDIGLSRAQPERSLTLLDRALTTYRLSAHSKSPHEASLEEQLEQLGDKLVDPAALTDDARPALESKRDDLLQKLAEVRTAWVDRQRQIKEIYAEVREGEEAIRGLEIDIEQHQQESAQRLQSVTPDAAPASSATFVPFAARAAAAGYDSEETTALKRQINAFQVEVEKNRSRFDALTAEVNDTLELGRDQVLTEFSNISGIPVSKLTQDERAKLLHLDANLGNQVFGQPDAISKLANQIRVARAGLQTPNRPQAAFMFLGPSGVGKTELAKALTSELFDDERALLRFDMSQYMEKHAVAKLIGAPPGYEGYEAGGILTNEMRKNPRRIILFDEIEKAHADIFNVFLQILDDARLTDNRGLTVSFRDAIILMTTNIGTTHFLEETEFDVAKGLAMGDLEDQYRPEFLARFNGKRNIVCFKTLDLPVIEKIASRDIHRLNEMVQSSSPNISIEIEPRALTSMCRDHYQPVNGARGITGYIEGVIKPQIAQTVLFAPDAAGTVHIGYDESSREVVVNEPTLSELVTGAQALPKKQ